MEQAAQNTRLFDVQEQATIRLTFEMTRAVRVGDETFRAVQSALPDATQVIELVGVIAAYNMVSRFLVALDILPE